MDEDPKDLKQSAKNSPFDQYTKHFNYSIFPNLKVYSLSTQPLSSPVDSAAASAAADNKFPFSDPQPIVKALPSESAPEGDLVIQKHPNLKQQHLNLKQQLEQHKNYHSEKRQTEQNQVKERPEPPVRVLPLQEVVPVAPRPQQKTTPTLGGGKLTIQQSKITETLFPPHTSQQESSKSILFGTFTDRWMSNNGSALVLATGPIGDPADMRNRVRSMILKVRGPIADYQAKNGVPTQQQISFIDLIRMLFICSQTAVFTILTMLWNLYPLLDGFLYVLRFVLDKMLYVCQGESAPERTYRGSIFLGEVVILFLANLFIVNLIVMPITHLVMCTMGNCMRLMGLHP